MDSNDHIVVKYKTGQFFEGIHKGSEKSAAIDLKAGVLNHIKPGDTFLFPTGLYVEIPEGHVGLIVARSGLGTKGLVLSNQVGVIDSDYRGEVKVGLYNRSGKVAYIDRGERIAQMMIVKLPTVQYQEVEELSETERGEGGFGSTGVK